MKPEHFVLWLQGFCELHPDLPSQEQWDSIREHLAAVFHKVTPELKVKDEPKTKPSVSLNWDEIVKGLPAPPPSVTLPYYPDPGYFLGDKPKMGVITC